jgi:hypothetical protein
VPAATNEQLLSTDDQQEGVNQSATSGPSSASVSSTSVSTVTPNAQAEQTVTKSPAYNITVASVLATASNQQAKQA